GAVVTYTDQVDRLYRREMNRAAFDMARRPASQTPDVPSAVRPITELAGQTLEVTRVEVWLPDDDRTVMRWIDGYDCATGNHPVREDVPLCDPLDAIGDAGEEPLTHGYDLPAPAGSLLGCPHGSRQVASVLEAAVRVRGRTGVLCLQHEGR